VTAAARSGWLALALLAGPLAAQAPPDAAGVRQDLFLAEDHRAPTAAALAALLRGLEHPDPEVAAQAARGLGRLERPALIPRLAARLADPRPAVRFEVAHALAQAASAADTADPAALELTGRAGTALLEHAARERDPRALGAVARSLGRLPWPSAAQAEAARRTLVDLTRNRAVPEVVLEAARGLEHLQRVAGRRLAPSPPVAERLQALAVQYDGPPDMALRIRRIAWAALPRAGGLTGELLARGVADPDGQVRRLVVLAAAGVDGAGRRDLLARALRDPDPMVRLEALRAWGRLFQAAECGPVRAAVADSSDHVALLAIDLLAGPCPDADRAALLGPFVDTLAGAQRPAFFGLASWHRGAHALVTLAKVAPERVRGLLARAAADDTWQVRMYAARAAAELGDAARLLTLAHDRDDNVREAAVQGLVRVRGPAAAAVYTDQLRRGDYQLVMTAAAALAGTPDRGPATAALLAALARITRERRETSRDARVALLERIAELGDPVQAPLLEPWLADFDSVVAARAAGVIGRWTGREPAIAPVPLPDAEPSLAAALALRGRRLRVIMSPTAGSGVFEIELLPELAPATVARVAQLAEEGWYDGLTFHRVVPNFVIQGGSPGANEYAGDGPYLRDEVGPLPHERGTLGISTRGRDTGDAQVFVNLVDNPRLDFNYTVWGRVVAGMSVVDGILEGDVMARVRLVDGPGGGRQP
jgi:cyclophilin family peptidyl-prolyl cis-trans isomerase